MFDIEKKESIKTLILTLWKRDDEAPKRSEEVALSNAVSAYIERITGDKSVIPCFNTFYEFVRDDYRRQLERKNVREKDFDIDGFLNPTRNWTCCTNASLSLSWTISKTTRYCSR